MDLALSVNEKAVSVGEESNVSIINSKFHDVGVGVVSKDGSRAVVSSTIIDNYRLYAAMSYMEYSKSSLHIFYCDTGNNNRAFLCQSGTMMTVDNNKIQESVLNIKEL